ncbi:MAG: hypothetical protein IT354_00855 [Gemmatimonadaceae bacterium]|jgi:putative Mn2+ efflux pump MntP|nr:hypothetical protein [Gemmatimonadaceae bacterium]
MTKLLTTCCTFVLSALGWYAGESFGMFTAFMLSMVGVGAGYYVGRRISRHWDF